MLEQCCIRHNFRNTHQQSGVTLKQLPLLRRLSFLLSPSIFRYLPLLTFQWRQLLQTWSLLLFPTTPLSFFPSLFPAVWSHYRPSTLSNWFPLSFSYSPLSLPPSLPCCEQSIAVISGCSPLSAFSLLLHFFSTFFSFSILNTFVPPAHPSEHTLTHTHRSSTSLSDFQHDTEGLTLTNFLPWLDFSLFFGEQVWNVFRPGRLLPTSSHCVYKMAAWGRRGGVTEWCLCSSLSGDTHACSHPLTQWVSLQCSAFLRRTRPWQPFWGRAGRDQYSTVIYSMHVVIHTNSPNHIQQQYTDNNFGFSTI